MLDLLVRHKRALALSLMLTALLYLTAILLSGYEQIMAAAARPGWSGWLLLLLASFCSYVFRFLRWQLYLQQLGYHLPWHLHFLYYLSGFALTTTPGKAGETIRSLYLNSHGIPFTHSLAMFFTERFLDVVIVSLLACLALLDFAQYGKVVIGVVVVLVLMLPLWRGPWIVHALQHLGLQLRWRRLRQGILDLAALLDSARSLFGLRMLYSGLGLGMLAWLIQGLAFYFIVQTQQLDIGMGTALSIYALGLLGGALSFVPGGIGTTEAVMALLLGYSGASTTEAIAIPVISRLTTLWFAVSLGLLASLLISLRRST